MRGLVGSPTFSREFLGHSTLKHITLMFVDGTAAMNVDTNFPDRGIWALVTTKCVLLINRDKGKEVKVFSSSVK